MTAIPKSPDNNQIGKYYLSQKVRSLDLQNYK